jgi:hypothetical protein
MVECKHLSSQALIRALRLSIGVNQGNQPSPCACLSIASSQVRWWRKVCLAYPSRSTFNASMRSNVAIYKGRVPTAGSRWGRRRFFGLLAAVGKLLPGVPHADPEA